MPQSRKKSRAAAAPSTPTRAAAAPSTQTRAAAAPSTQTRAAAAPSTQSRAAGAPSTQTRAAAAPSTQSRAAGAPAPAVQSRASAAPKGLHRLYVELVKYRSRLIAQPAVLDRLLHHPNLLQPGTRAATRGQAATRTYAQANRLRAHRHDEPMVSLSDIGRDTATAMVINNLLYMNKGVLSPLEVDYPPPPTGAPGRPQRAPHMHGGLVYVRVDDEGYYEHNLQDFIQAVAGRPDTRVSGGANNAVQAAVTTLSMTLHGHQDHNVVLLLNIDRGQKRFVWGYYDPLDSTKDFQVQLTNDMCELLGNQQMIGFTSSCVNLGKYCENRKCLQYYLDANMCHFFCIWFAAAWVGAGHPLVTNELAMRQVVLEATSVHGQQVTRQAGQAPVVMQLLIIALARMFMEQFEKLVEANTGLVKELRDDLRRWDALDRELQGLGLPARPTLVRRSARPAGASSSRARALSGSRARALSGSRARALSGSRARALSGSRLGPAAPSLSRALSGSRLP